MNKTIAYINGKFIDTSRKLDIYSPETMEVVSQSSSLGKGDIIHAYKSAEASQRN
jgi:acyl-CoA reductase-like NAD-dependent aldehyde dehydrogenase